MNQTMMASLAGAEWHKSTYSGGQGDCVEVAFGIPGNVPVRDSKRPNDSVVAFANEAWSAFLRHLN